MRRKEAATGIENLQIDAYERYYKTFLGYYNTEKEEDMCDER